MGTYSEIECRVIGKVQQVMYRDFVQRKARALRITGEVENLPDWTVRVCAQGDQESLEKFIEYLHKGPFLARVSHVDIEWLTPGEKFSGFKIKY
jgi:acylphosphatase